MRPQILISFVIVFVAGLINFSEADTSGDFSNNWPMYANIYKRPKPRFDAQDPRSLFSAVYG